MLLLNKSDNQLFVSTEQRVDHVALVAVDKEGKIVAPLLDYHIDGRIYVYRVNKDIQERLRLEIDRWRANGDVPKVLMRNAEGFHFTELVPKPEPVETPTPAPVHTDNDAPALKEAA